PLLQERGVSVELSSDGSLPINADPDDLRLVWSNLLENAVHFSPPGGRVYIRARKNGDFGTIEVEDDGPGIAAADLPHIFERFYRGDRSRARETGSYGLGLAIAKALIEAYAGSITPESSPGQGVRMLISLPLASLRRSGA
ncbi:MAG: sensor histidine kinase, partial [Candidatus Korobacteraceae bacterium]